MRVLSLFDGISCARVALDKLGISNIDYYASEIENNAITVSQNNWPEIKHIGDVAKLKADDFKNIDLLIGGSPCQDLSIATANRQGLDGKRSGLFYEYVRLLNEIKPKYFILENVASMRDSDKQIITDIIGVEPIMINASLVSAQARKRYFWTNIPGVKLPADKGIVLADVLQWELTTDEMDIYENFRDNVKHGTDATKPIRVGDIGYNGQAGRVYCICGKSVTINAGGGGAGGKTGLYAVPKRIEPLPGYRVMVPEATKKGYAIANSGDSIDISFMGSKTRRGRVGNKAKNIMTSSNVAVNQDHIIRKLTAIECERLMGLPDNYTNYISKTGRIKACGNAFNADVIAHILSFIPEVSND